jgi:hypothetical protein
VFISIEEWLASLVPSFRWWPLTGYGTFLLAMILVGVLSIVGMIF